MTTEGSDRPRAADTARAGSSGWLEHPPAEHGWEFPPEEYRRRVDATRRRMAEAGIDCLFLTSEKNIRYLAGFHSQTWVSPTRPRYVLLPLTGEPVAVVPTSNVPGMRATSWIEDLRAWPAPRPADDGISLVIEALAELAGPRDPPRAHGEERARGRADA